MDSATILVLMLCAGVAALLVWFEVNSRRNQASKQQKSDVVQAWFEALPRESQSKVESGTEKKKAALALEGANAKGARHETSSYYRH